MNAAMWVRAATWTVTMLVVVNTVFYLVHGMWADAVKDVAYFAVFVIGMGILRQQAEDLR